MEARNLRDATTADMAAVAEIYGHHVLYGLASFEETPPSAAAMEERRAAIAGHRLPYLVAEAEGRIMGFAYVGPYHHRPAYRFTLEDSVYIAPESQRRGVGRALLASLIERATAWGGRRMVAVIGDSGNAGSIRLHKALGFTPVGTLEAVGYKFERWVDVVIMQRALEPELRGTTAGLSG